jgi:hypothetical protein
VRGFFGEEGKRARTTEAGRHAVVIDPEPSNRGHVLSATRDGRPGAPRLAGLTSTGLKKTGPPRIR